MIKNLIFRPIQAKDNLEIAKVIRQVLEEFGVNKPGTVYTDPTTDDLHSLFRTRKSHYIIALHDQKIIGGCGIFPTKGLPENCSELVKLYVHKDYRSFGIGKQLMLSCIEFAVKEGYTSLYLETLPELRNAIGLYNSLGFKKLNTPLGNSGHFACDLWMLKKL